MECLFFLWWNFALYLACYDRTCYLEETLHCNMYMDGTMCMDGTCLCINGLNLLMYECMELMCWIYVIWMPVKYIYICHIYLLWKLLDLIKNRKRPNMQALWRLPPTATASLPSAADGKEDTWHPAVLPGSWPIWSVCLQWQTAKAGRILPSAADGKGRTNFAVSGGWQSPAVSHVTD